MEAVRVFGTTSLAAILATYRHFDDHLPEVPDAYYTAWGEAGRSSEAT